MKTGTRFGPAKDTRWLAAWIGVTLLLVLWDARYLNKPAFDRVITGFVNTFTIAFLVIAFTLALGWLTANALHRLESRGRRAAAMTLTFLLNLLRSVPQVVGILFGYVGVSALHDAGVLTGPLTIFPLLALCMSLFIFTELADLMRERISHFTQSDFYSAMRVCGISEGRIVNVDILWKNSRVHIFNKLISVFGMAVFLQCSVDFIISVGLSTDVNEVSLPATLGNLLAKIDSKQDILAIGYSLFHPSYIGNLFFRHLQGLTVAFLIVFTLLCVYNIANGFAERHKL